MGFSPLVNTLQFLQGVNARETCASFWTGRGVAIIDCSVDGKNIVVEMRREFTDEAMGVAQGTDFYVKGVVAEKRWGILHVLGMTEGEIIKP